MRFDVDPTRVVAYRDLADANALIDRGVFVAEGRLVVRRLLDLRHWDIESILLTQPAADVLSDVLPATTAPIYLASQDVMNGIAGFNIHRGCLAIVKRPQAPTLDRIAAGPLSRVLVLEGVNNPDNVGGLFRSAAAFGIELVVLGPNSGDPLYRKAIRTSMAASLTIPYARAPWPDALRELGEAGWATIAMTPAHDAPLLQDVAANLLNRPVAIVLGHEGDGLTGEAARACTHRARIAIADGVDSVNVATAAAIALYEIGRR